MQTTSRLVALVAALQVAVAWHYITEPQRIPVDAQLDRVGALTWGLTQRC